MTVFLAWTSAGLEEPLPGPWQEMRVVGPDLALIESDDTLSRVYHELKWSLPEGSALLVAPLGSSPKSKGLAPGSTSWLRDRLGSERP